MGRISLKCGVFVSRFDGGVVFRGGDAPVIFRGKRAHDLVRVLMERMERGASSEDVLAAVPQPIRAMTAQLLADLQRNGLLRTRGADDPRVELALRKEFLGLWNFLADRSARPGVALQRWRETAFVIVGPLRAGLYVARSLAECAATKISLVVPECEMASQSAVRELRRAFPESTFEVVPESSGPRQIPNAPDTVWIRACGDSEYSTSGPDIENAWYCGLLVGHLVNAFVEGRVSEVLPRWQATMRPAVGEGGQLAEQRTALAAAALAFGIFCRSVGIEDGSNWSAPRIVALDARITTVAPATLPEILPVSSVVHTAEVPAAVADIDPESPEVRSLFDPITGIFEQTDTNIAQVPLSIVQLKTYTHNRRAKPRDVYGWGMNVREAQLRAIQEGMVTFLNNSDICERELLPVVEWSRKDALDSARALAGLSCEPAGIHHSWVAAEIKSPETLKLYKLLELVVFAEPQVEIARRTAGHGVRIRVSLDGEVLAERFGANEEKALYEALGEACMRIQLRDSGVSLPLKATAPSTRCVTMPEAEGAVHWINHGFPALATQLFSAAV